MRRVARILAHVLATTTVVACGGKVELPDGAGPGPSPTTGSTVSPPSPTTTSTTVPPTVPPVFDGGPPKVDAGCTELPKLVRTGQACSDTWHHPCGTPAGVDPSDGLSQAECDKVCGNGAPGPGRYWGCAEYTKDDLPGPSFECFTCVEGRRPEGYVEVPGDGSIGGWLAHAADLERVSIDAFQILQRELVHHGAPGSLVASAARAEADEVRHARSMSSLALREGATLSAVPVVHGAPRSLVEIALENAVEGCIRETYGAVVAGYQAEHASRLDVRRLMSSIYRDETAHAELAWSVHAWISELLTAQERSSIEAAMTEAMNELVAAAGVEVPSGLRDELGLPPSSDARKLVRGLRVHLWMRELAA